MASEGHMEANTPQSGVPLFDTVLLLFRKDLRLYDNPALLAASQAARTVVPVYIWAPEEEEQFQPGRCSKWWLKQTLKTLVQQLESLGSRLIIRRAQDSTDMLMQLLQETGGQAVFFNHLFDPISLVRDHSMKQRLTAAGYTCRSYNADVLYEPWEVLDNSGEPFTTFNSFWGRLQTMPQPPPQPFPAPQALPHLDAGLTSLTVNDLDFFSSKDQEDASNQLGTKLIIVDLEVTSLSLDDVDFFSSEDQEDASNQLGTKWNPGSAGGLARLADFLTHQLPGFSHHKANVDRSVTGRLSPWIHVGSVSVRLIYHRVREKQSEWLLSGTDHSSCCQDFIQQLAYREYSRYLSFHFPFFHERPLLSHLRCVPWNLDQHAFKAWKMGLTGVPLVDAAMKELWSTGWMHNRLRVVCGVFAVKHLLLPWQWGLKHFWDALLDADLESDTLGWQYVAGCMIDAPPFGQLMNISTEAAAFDPDGEFVRRWLPVLARLPTAYVHAPWTAPQSVLDAADVELGFNYPHPLITQEVAEARIAEVAAIIEDSLLQEQQQQHVLAKPHQQQQTDTAEAAKQPYRPATKARQGYRLHNGSSGGRVSAAAAAAADMQRSASVLLQQQQQRRPQEVVLEVSMGMKQVADELRYPAAADFQQPQRITTPELPLHEAMQHPAAAAAARLPTLQDDPLVAAQGNPEWQELAVQGDIHLRHRQQQRSRQQRQQGRRYKGHQRWQQQQRGKYVYVEGSESECSVESEVFSSLPVVSEGQPTAWSGVQQDKVQQQQQKQQQQRPLLGNLQPQQQDHLAHQESESTQQQPRQLVKGGLQQWVQEQQLQVDPLQPPGQQQQQGVSLHSEQQMQFQKMGLERLQRLQQLQTPLKEQQLWPQQNPKWPRFFQAPQVQERQLLLQQEEELSVGQELSLEFRRQDGGEKHSVGQVHV